MKVCKYNDDFIRTFFKRYNNEMTDVVSETTKWNKPKGFVEKIFCGVFVAKVYVGQRIMGTYRFDCSEFAERIISDNARVRLTKVS